MKYFIDTEFIEGFHKPLLGKRRHFIDLISIGIVAEDGRTFHCISSEYDYGKADDWVKENVILPLYVSEVHGDQRNMLSASNFHKTRGIKNLQIAQRIVQFCNPIKEPEFYAYYGDYDWVVFCSLFGRMIDLPKGFPMYCRDLKQSLDEKAQSLVMQVEMKYPNETRFETSLRQLKNQPDFPKQINEHNSLSDAKWNKMLFDFLNPNPKIEILKTL